MKKEQDTESSGILGMDSIIAWEPSVVLDGVELTAEEWERIIRAKEGLVFVRGQWMELNAEDISRLEDYWQAAHSEELTSLKDILKISADPDREIVFDGELAEAMDRFRDPGKLSLLPQPESLNGSLRNYQLRGVFVAVACREHGDRRLPCGRHGSRQDDPGAGDPVAGEG